MRRFFFGLVYEDKADTVKQAVYGAFYMLCLPAKMDHTLTTWFIIAAVWASMEHRECIDMYSGGEKANITTNT